MKDSSKKTLVYFGHHKCASTFVNQVLIDVTRLTNHKLLIQYLGNQLPYDYHSRSPHKGKLELQMKEVLEGKYDFLAHSNADPSMIEVLKKRGSYKGFHVIRDPRDIVVSGYFSHMKSHPASAEYNPWMLEHRDRLSSLDKKEGMLAELEYYKNYFSNISNWDYQNPNILECKFEAITTNSKDEFAKIFEFLGITVSEKSITKTIPIVVKRILSKFGLENQDQKSTVDYCPQFLFERVLKQQEFRKLTKGRKKGEENSSSHFRKGVSGDWLNHFDDELKDKFKSMYPGLVSKLGYAENEEW